MGAASCGAMVCGSRADPRWVPEGPPWKTESPPAALLRVSGNCNPLLGPDRRPSGARCTGTTCSGGAAGAGKGEGSVGGWFTYSMLCEWRRAKWGGEDVERERERGTGKERGGGVRERGGRERGGGGQTGGQGTSGAYRG